MKICGIWILILGLTLCCYSQNNQAANATEIQIEKSAISGNDKDKDAIQQLIRQVLDWADYESSMSLFPVLEDNTNSVYVGLNLDEHQQNLEELESTNFFASEFIDNYNKIYLTLDKKLRNREFEWKVGELPPFGNDGNPWCNCQDVPYDEPDPWEFIEVEIISLDSEKGELNWKWGKLGLNADSGWKEFTYRFRVVKEEGRWRIAYLEGFDFDEFTRRNY